VPVACPIEFGLAECLAGELANLVGDGTLA
jgi:hypothetical protein